MHELARRDERVVQLLLAPEIAAVFGGLEGLRVLAVDRLLLGRGMREPAARRPPLTSLSRVARCDTLAGDRAECS